MIYDDPDYEFLAEDTLPAYRDRPKEIQVWGHTGNFSRGGTSETDSEGWHGEWIACPSEAWFTERCVNKKWLRVKRTKLQPGEVLF